MKSNISKERYEILEREFAKYSDKISHRGPDSSISLKLNNISASFKRLAILDVSSKGDQPFIYTNGNRQVIVMCNGEIYNYKDLYEKYNLIPKSNSDCEVILLMYLKFGNKSIEIMCNEFNSEHAFIIIDINSLSGDYISYISVDRFSIRPLFIGTSEDDCILISSELQGVPHYLDVKRFEPRHYAILDSKFFSIDYYQYYNLNSIKIKKTDFSDFFENNITSTIENLLVDSVKLRLNSDRPLGCLLSGGLDSSIVSAIASKLLKENGKILHTFSIGMKNSTDEKYALLTSKYIDSIHTHVECTQQEFFDAIPNVIKTLGSYDITTVRASVGQYLISKYISENTDIKVLLVGDFSDELTGGYKYFKNAPSLTEFNQECIRLLNDIHLYDGLRADRCISRFGIEARFPFADYRFIEYYLSINPELRWYYNGNIEKYLLRISFINYLPKEILNRSKEAFSDGVSSENNSWYKIIQNSLESLPQLEEIKFNHLQPISKESLFYRILFQEYFGYNISFSKTIPYYWLPKWNGDIQEPSARVLL